MVSSESTVTVNILSDWREMTETFLATWVSSLTDPDTAAGVCLPFSPKQIDFAFHRRGKDVNFNVAEYDLDGLEFLPRGGMFETLGSSLGLRFLQPESHMGYEYALTTDGLILEIDGKRVTSDTIVAHLNSIPYKAGTTFDVTFRDSGIKTYTSVPSRYSGLAFI